MVTCLTMAANCGGNNYTTIELPTNTALINVFAFRTPANSYHYITGYAQVTSTNTVFLYYDAENSGDHLISVSYKKVS